MQLRRQRLGLGAVGVEDIEFGDAKARKRERDRLADAAGADQRDCAMFRAGDQVADRARKAGAVGVVPDQPSVADDDGVDRADGARLRRHLVEQRDHGFLVGEGDVDAGEAKAPDAIEQRAQGGRIGVCDLDQLIMAANAQRIGRLFMHGRRRRAAQSAHRSARSGIFRGSGLSHQRHGRRHANRSPGLRRRRTPSRCRPADRCRNDRPHYRVPGCRVAISVARRSAGTSASTGSAALVASPSK